MQKMFGWIISLCYYVLTLSCSTIWALSNIENDIWNFGVKFEVELSKQHKKTIYHLKAYNFRIAIMKNNFSFFHIFGHMT